MSVSPFPTCTITFKSSSRLEFVSHKYMPLTPARVPNKQVPNKGQNKPGINFNGRFPLETSQRLDTETHWLVRHCSPARCSVTHGFAGVIENESTDLITSPKSADSVTEPGGSNGKREFRGVILAHTCSSASLFWCFSLSFLSSVSSRSRSFSA